jgi:hypothetical protein
MYIKAGEEKPFKATFALDFEEWDKTVTKFPLKCKCSNFFVSELDRYCNFEADFINQEKIRCTIDDKNYEISLLDDKYQGVIDYFYINPDNKKDFIEYCVMMIKKREAIYFETGMEPDGYANTYYDIFLDILLDDFPFDEYNLNAFCSDYCDILDVYYKTINIRKVDKEKGINPGPHKLEFPSMPNTSKFLMSKINFLSNQKS